MTFDLSMPPQKFLSYVADWEKQQSKRHHFKEIDSIERTVVWILWRVALRRLLLGTFLLRCECQILLRSPVVLQWTLLSHSLRDQPARISSCFVHEGLIYWLVVFFLLLLSSHESEKMSSVLSSCKDRPLRHRDPPWLGLRARSRLCL